MPVCKVAVSGNWLKHVGFNTGKGNLLKTTGDLEILIQKHWLTLLWVKWSEKMLFRCQNGEGPVYIHDNWDRHFINWVPTSTLVWWASVSYECKKTTVVDIKLVIELRNNWARKINGLQVFLLVAESIGTVGVVKFEFCWKASLLCF